jgi:hypothetical protein
VSCVAGCGIRVMLRDLRGEVRGCVMLRELRGAACDLRVICV